MLVTFEAADLARPEHSGQPRTLVKRCVWGGGEDATGRSIRSADRRKRAASGEGGCSVSKLDRIKEELGWLKVVLAASIAIDVSLIAWLAQNFETASSTLLVLALIGDTSIVQLENPQWN